MGHRLYATFKKLKQIVSLAREEFFREDKFQTFARAFQYNVTKSQGDLLRFLARESVFWKGKSR